MNENFLEELEAQARDRSTTIQSDTDGRAFRQALAKSKQAGLPAPTPRSPFPALGFTLAGAALASAVILIPARKKAIVSHPMAVAKVQSPTDPISKWVPPVPSASLTSTPKITPEQGVPSLSKRSGTKPEVSSGDDLAFLQGDGLEGYARRWGTLSTSDAQLLERQWVASIRGGDDFVHVTVPSLAGVNNAGAAEALRLYQEERQRIDSRLQRRVTLQLKGEPFGELCALLSREAGIELTAARTVTDDKVTIFCKERPIRELLRDIVNLFGFTVERTGSEENYKYRLNQPLRAQLLEEELRNRDSSEALVDLDHQLEDLQKLGGNLSPAELKAQASDATGDRKAQLEKLATNGWGAAKLYAGLGQEDMAALRSGKTLRFSGETLPVELRNGVLASQDGPYLTQGKDGRPKMQWGKQAPNAVLPDRFPGIEPSVTLSLTRNELGQYKLTGSAGGTLATGPDSRSQWNNQVELGVGTSPSTRFPENAKARANRAMEPSFQKEILFMKSSEKAVATTADALEALHKATGRDIIADYYTRLVDLEVALPKGKTSLFAALCQVGDRCKLRWDEKNGIFSFRSIAFFNDRPKEVPQRLIQKWIKNRRGGSESTVLENILEMAQLRDEPLNATTIEEGLVALYGLEEWRLARNATLRENWRLLASFPRPLRTAALTERGATFEQMGAAQRPAFVNLNWSASDAAEILSNSELIAKLTGAAFHLRFDFAAKTDRERAMFSLTAPGLDRVGLFWVNQSRSGGMDMPLKY